ncbi:MAG TPA: hypothetical protein VGS21_04780 [Acidimicrobiales bacterium]|nr:hypothetical protein [Acidimicrobiales bacterium]
MTSPSSGPRPIAALTPVGSPQQGAVRRGLPGELTRAWDEAALSSKRKRSKGSRKPLAIVAGVAVVGAALAAGAALEMSGHARTAVQPPKVAAHPFMTADYAFGGVSFAVSMPPNPASRVFPQALAGIPYRAATYTSQLAGVGYSVGVYPYPIGKPIMSADKFLTIMTREMAKTQGLKASAPAASTLNGLPAVKTTLVNPSHTLFIEVFAVLQGHVGYMLMTTSTNGIVPDYSNFLDSFRLLH